MPFLHWEEDRKREKMAKMIQNATERSREKRERNQTEDKLKRVDKRTYEFDGRPALLKSSLPPIQHPKKLDSSHDKIIQDALRRISSGIPNASHPSDFPESANALIRGDRIEYEYDKDGRKGWPVAKLHFDKHGRVKSKNELGQFLLDAARLYEAISMHRDQQLVEEYLHHDPPLHPRRTLDQSYYWTLKTTKTRDRDQVVYRGTMMDDRNMHKLRNSQGKECKEKKSKKHLENP
ncbi:uncharacterized protein ColSpa_04719 [Colletotrichum spaethianum]|uniref:Uncharacterized protein n=1 Tax=Colletotrichum spaethianum TaxID=700344 RepID=A0AA37LDR5_9PEZI|nr:uncharacterized protein ColSpa_04719 [Colletotrichum spaethianum]GKT44538.1 hypothetical protein ColSpa_04719 [Colletotrichum spaethianum]